MIFKSVYQVLQRYALLRGEDAGTFITSFFVVTWGKKKCKEGQSFPTNIELATTKKALQEVKNETFQLIMSGRLIRLRDTRWDLKMVTEWCSLKLPFSHFLAGFYIEKFFSSSSISRLRKKDLVHLKRKYFFILPS